VVVEGRVTFDECLHVAWRTAAWMPIAWMAPVEVVLKAFEWWEKGSIPADVAPKSKHPDFGQRQRVLWDQPRDAWHEQPGGPWGESGRGQK